MRGTVSSMVDADAANGRLHAFQISNITTWKKSSNRLILSASSASEAQQWVSCLNLAAQSTSTTTSTTTTTTTTTGGSAPTMAYVSLKDLKVILFLCFWNFFNLRKLFKKIYIFVHYITIIVNCSSVSILHYVYLLLNSRRSPAPPSPPMRGVSRSDSIDNLNDFR